MLKFWYKDLPQYSRNHQDYWRVRFIYHLLLACNVVFLINTFNNIVLFQDFDAAGIGIVGILLSLAIYFWFRKTANLNLAAWCSTIYVTVLVMIFVYLVYGGAHAFVYATLIPPIAFFLIGKFWGAIFSAVLLLFCVVIAYDLHQSQVTYSFSFGSVLNVLVSGTALIAILRFYEGTRSDAYHELMKRAEHTKLLSETDRLTGLCNREKLDRHLNKLLKGSAEDCALALLVIDIDHFKQINDENGHLVGDQVLKEFANMLQQKMRKTDLLARWGGEEFVAILSQTSEKQACDLAEKFRLFIKQKPVAGINLTVSIGVTAYQRNDLSISILKRADDALYQAKNNGRDRVVCQSLPKPSKPKKATEQND